MRIIELNNKASGLINSTIKYANFAESTITFELVCADIAEPAPYSYLEEVRATLDGVTVLEGVVLKCEQEIAGDEYKWSVEIADRWWHLASGNFVGRGDGGSEYADKRQNVCATVRDGSGGGLPYLVSAQMALKVVLDNAVAAGMIKAYDISLVDPIAILNEFSVQGSWASGLRKIKTDRPNLISYFDYLRSLPTLIIVDQDRVAPVLMDVHQHKLKSISINPRTELVPPCVGVLGVNTSRSRVFAQYPPDVDIRHPGGIVKQMSWPESPAQPPEEEEVEDKILDNPSFNFTRQSMRVKGVKLPYDLASARRWWAGKYPLLKQSVLNVCTFGRVEKEIIPDVEKDKVYSEEATTYELVQGAISEKSKALKWCEIEFRQRIELIGYAPPAGYKHLFPDCHGHKHWGGWLRWRGRTINRASYVYTIAPEMRGSEDGEDYPPEAGEPAAPPSPIEPDYTAVCKSLYDSTRIVPWSGSLTSIAPPTITALVGHTLNIAGGRPGWATMQTIIQTISYNVYAGSASITTGVAEHLSLDTMLERSRLIKQQSQQTQQDQQQGNTDERRNGGLNFQFDPRSRQTPKAPTIAPSGHVVLSEQPSLPEYGFQTIITKTDKGDVTGCLIRHGMIIMHDAAIYSGSNDGSGPWAQSDIKEGNVYLKVSFSGGADAGKFLSAEFTSIGGSNTPFYHGLDSPPAQGPTYYFLIASISGKQVTQFALGSVYIQVAFATDYPYGPPI